MLKFRGKEILWKGRTCDCVKNDRKLSLPITKKFAGWWFQIFFIFTPIWGNDAILTNIFRMGWIHQLICFLWIVKSIKSMGFENNGLQLLETWYDKLGGIRWSSRFGTPNGLVITKRVPSVVPIYSTELMLMAFGGFWGWPVDMGGKATAQRSHPRVSWNGRIWLWV